MKRASDLWSLRLTMILCCALGAGAPLAHAQEPSKPTVEQPAPGTSGEKAALAPVAAGESAAPVTPPGVTDGGGTATAAPSKSPEAADTGTEALDAPPPDQRTSRLLDPAGGNPAG
ncbi:MAG TPA: hypothetical protein VLZ56_00940, partial [Mycoplana sp.]|nr:hypothetical protein [Mycoplana sp.]